MNMADCLSFVTNGSTVSKPEKSCCSGLKTVLKGNPDCLCEGFKNSAQLGVDLNMTKAMSLPAACHVSTPSSIKTCIPKSGNFFPSPSAAPSASPSSSGLNSAPTISATGPAASSPSPNQVNSASSAAVPVAATLTAAAILGALLF